MGAWKKTCVLLLLGEVFYKCWLVLLVLSSLKSWLTFCLCVISIIERMVLKFPTTIMDLSMSPFSSNSLYFTCFGALWFGAYTFKLTLSPWWVDPFIIMQFPYEPDDFLGSGVYIYINSHSRTFQKSQQFLSFVVLSTEQTNGSRHSLLLRLILLPRLTPPYLQQSIWGQPKAETIYCLWTRQHVYS